MTHALVSRRRFLGGVAVATPLAVAGAFWLPRQFGGEHKPGHVDLGSLPAETAVRYRFVEAHPDLAERIPCYCGCGKSLGHQSLKDCYLRPNGYNDHAVGCLICGQIASDAEELSKAGLDVAAIRARIDEKYSVYGPPTDTP